MKFVITEKLNQEEATTTYNLATHFFNKNPKRRVIRTDWFKIRRKYIKEDILEHCKVGVKL